MDPDEGPWYEVAPWSTIIKFTRGNSPLVSPFRLGSGGDRDEVLRKYRVWLWNELRAKAVTIQSRYPVANEFDRLLWILVEEGSLVIECIQPLDEQFALVLASALEWAETVGRDGWLDAMREKGKR